MSIILKTTWDKFTQEEKERVQKLYEHYEDDALLYGDEPHKLVKANLESIFPEEALHPQPLTYKDVAKKLFKNKECWVSTTCGIKKDIDLEHIGINNPNICTSYRQALKILAINKLLNVAKFLNKDWKPDWSDDEEKWTLGVDPDDNIVLPVRISHVENNTRIVYFRTKQLAEQAIQILGEEVIRLALTTEY